MDNTLQRFAIRLAPLLIGAIAVGFSMIRGCQTGPFGRSQVVALNPQQESALGAQSFQQVIHQSQVVPDGPMVRAVQQIAVNLVHASKKPGFLEATRLQPQAFQWELRVVQSREANAFCLPGGKIVVYTGILPIAESNAGLATVLAHEIGHALAHHGAERMAQEKMANIAVSAAAGSMRDLDPRQQQQLMGLIGAGAKFGVLLPYSRNHESEADHIGLLLMAQAGYDPRESVDFWKRMSQQSAGRQPPQFMSTHPSHDHRVHDLTAWQEEAAALYQQAETRQDSQRLPVQ